MATLFINVSQKQAVTYAVFLVIYEFFTYIANDMVMPGMLKVVSEFHGLESSVALSLTAYVAGGASLQLFLGPLSDHYGRRPVMIAGAFFFFICTVAIACSQTMDQFLVARFFQGMGLCFIGVIGYATLQEIFSEMDAIRLIAVMANVAITAPLLGPLVGAIFVYYFNWRFIFVGIGLGALVALWGIGRYMPESVGQTMHDGTVLKRAPLGFRKIWTNYKNLLINPPFLLGSIALGLVYLPCMSWIALSPVILVKGANITIIEYGLWQIPVFMAYAFGNLWLHRMTRRGTVKKMILVGSCFASISMLMTYLLPALMGQTFLWLMPGLMVYFFGIGIVAAPLNRLIIFSTQVSKGTASALSSMISMSIQAIGIEVANVIYTAHNNANLGLYCAVVAIVYVVCLGGCFLTHHGENKAVAY